MVNSVTTFWKLFGNGRGTASPYFDDTFYYLNGRFYRWVGGFGAQLSSVEWRAPAPGTRRRLIGRDFVVFQTERRLLRVRVTWALVTRPSSYGSIADLRRDLVDQRYDR
jgi:hypothetical protein